MPPPCRRASLRWQGASDSFRASGCAFGAGAGAWIGQRADVVVLFGVAKAHRVRRLLHAWQQRREQLLLGENQVAAVVASQLVLVAHGQRARRAGFDAKPAEDAASIVDLVDAGVPLTWGVTVVLGVVPAFDVDRVGRASPGAQF